VSPASDSLLESLKRLHPLLIDLSLGRIERLLARLGHPERRLAPVVHVAGTNGKGSTTAFLKAMLEAAGRRVHVYTSPHLVRFNERIQVPGPGGRAEPIGEERLAAALARVERVNAGEPITFFEITTAAALHVFAEMPADAVLLEVGLGGRLDATNVVVRPAISIITQVSMDHADKLGGTLAAIAGEKAGILKSGVPAVIAPQEVGALEVIRARAAEVGAPLAVWGEDFEAFEQNGRMIFQQEDRLLDLPRPALIGRHQIVNAGTAIAAALGLAPRLPALALDEHAIERGLLGVEWPARMQRLATGPLAALAGPEAELWLDGGHNPAGGAALAQTMADLEERSAKPLYLVAGMMGQKDAAGFLGPFRGLARRIVAVPIPGAHEAPYQPEVLARIARRLGFEADPADGVPAALTAIGRLDTGPRRILICGSLYLAGHVLGLQQGVAPQAN
jgi:dihydrofolate synthase/folylpolyglutamate synthase